MMSVIVKSYGDVVFVDQVPKTTPVEVAKASARQDALKHYGLDERDDLEIEVIK